MIEYLNEIGCKAKKASSELNKVSMAVIDKALLEMANALIANKDTILKANQVDVELAMEKKTSPSLIDRLRLDESRINDLALNLRNVADLKSPLDTITYSYASNKEFKVSTKVVPLGVITIIYEARPNVSVESLSLCLKTKNAIILRGSTSTLNTNRVLVNILNKEGLIYGLPDGFVSLVESFSHDDVITLVKMVDYIDVVIPRGGANLINTVVKHAQVPVIETGTGNNYAYIDNSADIDQAIKVILNAKTNRVSVCNSLEKLLVDASIQSDFYDKLDKALTEKKTIIKACPLCISCFSKAIAFQEEDYDIEYLDYIIGVKVVNGLDEAISIINKYSSKHSNLILSNDFHSITKFSDEIDSACVFVNTTTRFADGVEFGLGSEIGISTQKMHARGPMGLDALTSTKSIVTSDFKIK